MEIINLKDYSIFAGALQDSLPGFLRQLTYSQLIVIVDENTRQYCLPVLDECLTDQTYELIEISSGEQHKNIETCQYIWQQMMRVSAGRDALVLNLGGGVIGDMGGFCAGTFKRGIRFIQVPTTLLSQVDASIGGKLGIDFMQVKNSIGLFQNPEAVIVDPAFLKTLSHREVRSGFAEIIKHSLIADAEQWSSIKQINIGENINWKELITPSLLIKKRIVEEDPFEKGLRKALNFGHTIGHAVEGVALESDTPLLHGESIAIGMICETYLSRELLQLDTASVLHITRYLLDVYGHHPLAPKNYDTYISLMQNDKKNEGKAINFSLINPIGQAVVNQTCSTSLIRDSLDFYNDLGA
jgi:3-dehydroquinate synthase